LLFYNRNRVLTKNREADSENKASSATAAADYNGAILDLQEKVAKQKENIESMRATNESMRAMFESFVMFTLFLFLCLFVVGWRLLCHSSGYALAVAN